MVPNRVAHDDVDRLEKEKIDKRRVKEKDSDDLKVVESVFDKATVLTVDKLIRKGIIKNLVGIVSTGKEANVYLAKDSNDVDLALKIFRTQSEFRKYAMPYIEGCDQGRRLIRRVFFINDGAQRHHNFSLTWKPWSSGPGHRQKALP